MRPYRDDLPTERHETRVPQPRLFMRLVFPTSSAKKIHVYADPLNVADFVVPTWHLMAGRIATPPIGSSDLCTDFSHPRCNMYFGLQH